VTKKERDKGSRGPVLSCIPPSQREGQRDKDMDKRPWTGQGGKSGPPWQRILVRSSVGGRDSQSQLQIDVTS